MIKKYNRNNFHRSTYCEFQEVAASELPKDKPDYESSSGSKYYFTEKGVFRISNHWGRAAKCKWKLVSKYIQNTRTKIGFATWDSFYEDDENKALYFVDFKRLASGYLISYQHQNHPSYNGQMVRTASQTAKMIKRIKELMDSDKKLNHLPLEERESARNEWIQECIYKK